MKTSRIFALFTRLAAVLACSTSLQALAVQGVSWTNLTRGGSTVTSPLFVSAGDTLKFDVNLTANGAANPPGTSGLGICLEYARNVAGDPAIANLLATDLAADGQPDALSGCNKGGAANVPGADFAVIKGWLHLSVNGGWPNVALPVKLYDAQFTLATSPVGSTLIGFGASSVAAAETFSAPAPIVLCGRPAVTIAKVADGSETGPVAAKFDVTLSAAVPSSCSGNGVFPVSFTISGSAIPPGQPNADYNVSGSGVSSSGQTLTINYPADGATRVVSVVATPIDDTFGEGTETITLAVAAGSGNYIAGATPSATANITDNDSSSITLTTVSVPNGTVAVGYVSQTFTATGGVGPYAFTLNGGALPPGLALSGGTLSGTPTAAGTFDFAITATDSTPAGSGGPKTDSKSYRIIVAKGSQTITFTTLADRALYSPALSLTANTTASLTVTFSTTGGCSLSGSTLTTTGVGTCTVRASQAGNANYNAAPNVDRGFNVLPPTITLGPGGLAGGILGATYSGSTLNAGGALAPYAFTVQSGALPPGLTLATGGVISGTPTQAGTFNFTVKATDASAPATGGPFIGTQTFSIDVSRGTATVAVSSNVNPSVLGQPVVITATVTGGAATPTGTVTFVDISTPICTAVPLASGQATCTTSSISSGTHPLSANYSGDNRYAAASAPTYFQTVQPASGRTLTVSKSGNGTGGVTSTPAGIDCGNTCSQFYTNDTLVALVAAPTGGSTFLGWLGACGGNQTCSVNVNGPTPVTAWFAPAGVTVNVDIDGNGRYDALTDGVLVIRYLFGLTGQSLIAGAVGSGATRADSAQIIARLDQLRPVFDIDADGRVDALSDGVLLIRYLFGLRGPTLVAGATAQGATRSPAQIETYIQSLMP